MTDLSYSHGMLARNKLRWHGLGFLPPDRATIRPAGRSYRRSTACQFNVCERCHITWCGCRCHERMHAA